MEYKIVRFLWFLQNVKRLGTNMSIKVHVLPSHLDRFAEKFCDFSEKPGERFH